MQQSTGAISQPPRLNGYMAHTAPLRTRTQHEGTRKATNVLNDQDVKLRLPRKQMAATQPCKQVASLRLTKAFTQTASSRSQSNEARVIDSWSRSNGWPTTVADVIIDVCSACNAPHNSHRQIVACSLVLKLQHSRVPSRSLHSPESFAPTITDLAMHCNVRDDRLIMTRLIKSERACACCAARRSAWRLQPCPPWRWPLCRPCGLCQMLVLHLPVGLHLHLHWCFHLR